MSNYVGYRDGGKTNEEGLKKELRSLFSAGIPKSTAASSLQVTQRGSGANMSVDVAVGDAHLLTPAGSYSYWGWADAINNVTISAADPTNPRIDVVVVYVDLTVVSTASNNNPGALKFTVVTGTAAGVPSAPSDSAIQTFLGATTPYLKLASVAVAAGVSTITTAVISDLRTDISLKAATSTTVTGGWNTINNAPSSVVANGNHSYTCTFTGDLTSTLSAGMRIRTTRTVAAPTQSTSLNGTTQFWSKTSPAGMTWTDTMSAGTYIKLAGYPSSGTAGIISRFNGTNGWLLLINTAGQLILQYGAGSKIVTSNQSIPLNKKIHVVATVTGTTATMYYDGASVPCSVTGSGTLTQAGNLEVGSFNGGTGTLNGTLAQTFVASKVLSPTEVNAIYSQGLTTADTTTYSMASAYSFNGNANDLNTTNANNLTSNNAVTATNADAPFCGQAGGIVDPTGKLDYGIVQSVSFSTNTTVVVQVPEGCTIPTSGGVSAVAYSSNKAPYGFPTQRGKWVLEVLKISRETIAIGAVNAWIASSHTIIVPIGSWKLGHAGTYSQSSSVAGARKFHVTLVENGPTNNTYTQPLTAYNEATASTATGWWALQKEVDYTVSTPTLNILYGSILAATGSESWLIAGDLSPARIYAENAFL